MNKRSSFITPYPSLQHKATVHFTLIELLIVIAIISILAGILMPALGKALERGREISCQSNFKQIGSAIHMYAGDQNDWVPFASCRQSSTLYLANDICPEIPNSPVSTVRFAMLIYFTSSYLQPKPWNRDSKPVPKIYICPSGSDDEFFLIGDDGINYGSRGNIYATPGMGFITFGEDQFRKTANGMGGRNFKRAKQPSQYGFIYDGRTKQGFLQEGIIGSWTNTVANFLNPVGTRSDFPLISFRHNKASNLLMADGHVEGGIKSTMSEVQFRRHFFWYSDSLLTSVNADAWWPY